MLSSTIQLERRLSDLEFVSQSWRNCWEKIWDGKPKLKAKVRYGAEAQQTNRSR